MPTQDKAISATTQIPTNTATPSPYEASQLPSVAVSPAVVEPLYKKRPKMGTKIGTLSLPSLKQNWPIYEGTYNSQLAKGVGHFRNSVMPGLPDNTVLSGHRTTVFKKLGKLKKNQLVVVKTSAGLFTYKIKSFRIVKRTNKTVIVPTKTGTLTLTTCYPFNNIGTTTKAYVVTAVLVKSELKK